MSEPQSITLTFPRDAEAVRQAILKELDSMGIAVKSLYGRVQEHNGPQPTLAQRTLQFIASHRNIAALCGIPTAASPILDDYFASKSASGIHIDAGNGIVIDLHGTTDIDKAMRCLKQLQCTAPNQDSDQAIPTSPSP